MPETNEIRLIDPNVIPLNVTYEGQNGDYIEMVPRDLTDAQVREIAEQALRDGQISNIPVVTDPDLTGFKVGRMDDKFLVRPNMVFG